MTCGGRCRSPAIRLAIEGRGVAPFPLLHDVLLDADPLARWRGVAWRGVLP